MLSRFRFASAQNLTPGPFGHPHKQDYAYPVRSSKLCPSNTLLTPQVGLVSVGHHLVLLRHHNSPQFDL